MTGTMSLTHASGPPMCASGEWSPAFALSEPERQFLVVVLQRHINAVFHAVVNVFKCVGLIDD